jgi:hypothetical protein
MFKILSTYICWKKIYKMQHLEGSGTLVLYIGRTVLKGQCFDLLIVSSIRFEHLEDLYMQFTVFLSR